jgi:predicted nucleic acid-binding protein
MFLDANIFLYAIGGDGPYRESCRAVLLAVGRGALDGVTNAEVLQEILHVRARRLSIKDATSAVRAAAGMVADLLPVTREDILEACALLNAHPGFGARDALHAAVMKNAGINLIVSVDRDFDAIKSLKRLVPKDALSLLD